MTPEMLRLLAYCPGPWCAAASKALGWESPLPCLCGPGAVPCLTCRRRDSDSDWIENLIPLYEAAATLECSCGISKCGAPGYTTHGRIPDEHVLLRLAVAVGWICHACDDGCYPGCKCEWSDDETKIVSGEPCKTCLCAAAMCATEAWLKDETDANMKAWCDALGQGFRAWIPMPYQAAVMNKWRSCFEAAIKIVGRDVLARCAVETRTEECQDCIGQGTCPDAFCLARTPTGPSELTCEDCEGTGRKAK